ncbi:MAG: ComEA family DNA-binding protein [bacterium]
MEEKTAPKPTLDIKIPPFFYYLACFFSGIFLGSFLTFQIQKDNYSLSDCFLVHEAVGEEPEVLGGSVTATTSGEGEQNVQTQAQTQIQNQPQASNLVSINNASLAELDTLPGIGPAYAQRIVDGRPYGSISEVLKVKGIGPKTFEKIRDLITL